MSGTPLRPLASGFRSVLLIVGLTLLCVALQNSRASAHAVLVSSVPADGAVIAATTKDFLLTFNEPVAPLVLKLVRPDGSAMPLDRLAPKDNSLAIEVPALDEGTHVLSWRVVSADGHPVGGSLVFSVGRPSVSGPPDVDAPAERPVAVALWLAKIGLYTGLFFGVGSAFFLSWTGSGRAGSLACAALGLGLVAAPIAVGLQVVDALELPLPAILSQAVWRAGFGTSFGDTALIASLSFVAAFAALAIRAKATAQPLSALALAGVGLALAASGHAADAEPHWLTRPAVFLHATAIAFWVGALAPLAALLRSGRPEKDAALARFSRLIPLPLIVLVATGTILAILQVETPSALVATGYGRVLLVKLGIVAALLALAARNRWRLTRLSLGGDETAAFAMARAMRVEIMLVVAILAVVTLWRFTPPPRVIAIEAARPATVHLHGEKAMADVSIAPGRAGQVAISVFVMTPAFEPLAAKEVTIVLANPAAGIEPFKRPATFVDGVWRIETLAVPFPGRWSMGLDVLVSDFEMTKLRGTIEIRP